MIWSEILVQEREKRIFIYDLHGFITFGYYLIEMIYNSILMEKRIKQSKFDLTRVHKIISWWFKTEKA